MLRLSKSGFVVFGAAALFLAGGVAPAAAKCQLIKATNSAASKALAAKAAQQNAIDNAMALKRQYGWKYVTLRARKVQPDPFWKAVRPVVTPDMLLKPDVVTAKTYSQCWEGVVVPYVCTAGAVACGN
jgi:hypothetical protein